eukprot:TRINITY_DN15145_c1_g2_i1.p1 TRINITY_DN15145_c1_g2~~TRINITY_DN15145_c1_g2_i1.p1  ORF type:complete len:369 (+),score=97.46 TRINITY_DN15145_c1_g2_i1:55-1107(+)
MGKAKVVPKAAAGKAAARKAGGGKKAVSKPAAKKPARKAAAKPARKAAAKPARKAAAKPARKAAAKPAAKPAAKKATKKAAAKPAPKPAKSTNDKAPAKPKPSPRKATSPGGLPDVARDAETEQRTLGILRAQYVNSFSRPSSAMRSAAVLQTKALGWLARARSKIEERGKSAGKVKKPKPGSRGKRSAGRTKARQLLLQRLKNLGLTLLPCLDDGNCQFRAVSRSLFGTQSHHLRLRKEAVAWMSANRADFEPFLPEKETWARFLAKAARPGTWGCNLTLAAMVNAVGVTVHILNDHDSGDWAYNCHEPQQDRKHDPPRHAFLAYETPVHYDALVGTPPEEPAPKRRRR